ncbi:glycosyltransferase [Peptococcaceae bacterium]|nr:glycosyltransferase [Peptococcaceae bacterium]
MLKKNKITVMHLIPYYIVGGAEKLTFEITSKMDKAKFNVFVCSIWSKEDDDIELSIRSDLQKQEVRTLSLNKFPRKQKGKNVLRAKIILGILKLAKILTENKVDILHTHCFSPIYQLAACMSRVAVTFSTIHNTAGYSSYWEKVFKHFTTKYIAVSEQVKKYAIDDLQIPPDKVELIYNGIDLQRFMKNKIDRENKLAKLRIDADKKIITNIGCVTEAKGQIYLIKAAKIVLKEFPDVHFLIVGDDKTNEKTAQKLKDMIRAEGLSDYITFTGIRQDVPEILAITDIFVFPSLWEGFALVVLEAIAAEVPIVATDVGIIREVLIDKENGLIVPPKDAEALAKSIKFMLKNPEKAREMGIKGKKTVGRFSIENTVQRYEELYLKYC